MFDKRSFPPWLQHHRPGAPEKAPDFETKGALMSLLLVKQKLFPSASLSMRKPWQKVGSSGWEGLWRWWKRLNKSGRCCTWCRDASIHISMHFEEVSPLGSFLKLGVVPIHRAVSAIFSLNPCHIQHLQPSPSPLRCNPSRSIKPWKYAEFQKQKNFRGSKLTEFCSWWKKSGRRLIYPEGAWRKTQEEKTTSSAPWSSPNCTVTWEDSAKGIQKWSQHVATCNGGIIWPFKQGCNFWGKSCVLRISKFPSQFHCTSEVYCPSSPGFAGQIYFQLVQPLGKFGFNQWTV